jgi:outer membrane protein
MNHYIKGASVLGFIITCLSSIVFAAPAPIITSTQANQDDVGFGIGGTTSIAKRPFVGVDTQNASLLYLSYRNNNFYVEGLDIGYRLYKNNSFHLDALATPRFYEVKPSFADGGELNSIDVTKETYLTGISAQFNTSSLVYTFQVLHDALQSNGNEIVLQVSKAFKLSEDFTLTPSIGIVNQDKTLVGHFYGVQSNEVISGRPAYAGNNALNYNVTLNASWYMTKHFELLGQYKIEKIGSGITDSPIIDKDTLSFITLGLVYRF